MQNYLLEIEKDPRMAQLHQEILRTEKISTTNDIFAKKLLSRKTILIDFLNAVLDRNDEKKILDLTYNNSEILGLTSDDKTSRLDITCTLVSGEKVNLEIQVLNEKAWIERSLVYWSRLYTYNLKRGSKYKNIAAVICIHLLKFNLFDAVKNPKPHSKAKLCNLEDGKPITDLMEFHFLELRKFSKKRISSMSRAEKWLAFFSGKLSGEDEILMKKDKIFDEALNLRNEFVKDPDEYLAYLKREMELMDYDNALYEAGLDGEARGIEKGKVEGIAESDYNKVKTLIEKKGHSLESALNLLDISKERWSEIESILKKIQK
ncbi:Rpn family recombination-promoting nuclease/putative transposase [Succinivibrio dextrinosolvens]|uniref:Rpn family recombination-promoting nuclease/putative transposase n=1 Tax=Succinivibrio dextrinosolvens TaxID=83771 RepID=UPI00241C557B|nr:Rpn family recombination-promoting nuclease/putative transposase [Succinivibrio dextrinosolvens]MBE6421869.1 Rpn family recombination-promoting nuclease/putative transposase [Succinivibrio dextrinosolvens]